jgi:hypothetical protein
MSLGLASIQGLKIISANSSLKNLSVRLENEIGLSLDAIADEDEIMVQLSVIKAQDLAVDSDAVCSVDWGWICGSTITSVKASSTIVRLQLSEVGPLTVSVNLWQGSPFLSFQPFKVPVAR